MANLKWERIKDLKRPVTQKTMYIAMAICLIIGLYLGNTYDISDITGLVSDEPAAIVESPNFAMVGDHITVRCEKSSISSVCGSRGYLEKGISTPYMVIWESGATTNYKFAPITNQTFEGDKYNIHNVTFEEHENARKG